MTSYFVSATNSCHHFQLHLFIVTHTVFTQLRLTSGLLILLMWCVLFLMWAHEAFTQLCVMEEGYLRDSDHVTCHVVSHGPKMPSRLLMWCVVCDSACTCPVVVYQTPVLSRILRYTVATLHRVTNTLLHVTLTGTNHTECCKHDVMSFSGWLCLRIGNWMVPTYTLKQTMIFLTAHYTKMWISS